MSIQLCSIIIAILWQELTWYSHFSFFIILKHNWFATEFTVVLKHAKI